MISGTEVEIKLVLPDRPTYLKAITLFSEIGKCLSDVGGVLQRNSFFDGPANELSSKRSIFRIRDTGSDKLLCTLKRGTVVKDGVARSEEIEETLGRSLLQSLLAETGSAAVTLPQNTAIFDLIRSDFGVSSVRPLGGFENLRTKFEWSGLVVEVDETRYSFGTNYEIEIECTNPALVKSNLSTVLANAGIQFTENQSTKFHRFVSGKL
eukprot:ANDGO_04894.mRNA.1 Triphosphate tunel metalloenzyme 3